MNEKQTHTMTVNGERRQVIASPQTMLMDALRDQLRLTGTKGGCAVGHCGSYMVIKDGEAVRSCIVPMKGVDGAEIITIEGVANGDGALHPVQQAYTDQGAPPCAKARLRSGRESSACWRRSSVKNSACLARDNATGVRCYNLPADKKWLKAALAAE